MSEQQPRQDSPLSIQSTMSSPLSIEEFGNHLNKAFRLEEEDKERAESGHPGDDDSNGDVQDDSHDAEPSLQQFIANSKRILGTSEYYSNSDPKKVVRFRVENVVRDDDVRVQSRVIHLGHPVDQNSDSFVYNGFYGFIIRQPERYNVPCGLFVDIEKAITKSQVDLAKLLGKLLKNVRHIATEPQILKFLDEFTEDLAQFSAELQNRLESCLKIGTLDCLDNQQFKAKKTTFGHYFIIPALINYLMKYIMLHFKKIGSKQDGADAGSVSKPNDTKGKKPNTLKRLLSKMSLDMSPINATSKAVTTPKVFDNIDSHPSLPQNVKERFKKITSSMRVCYTIMIVLFFNKQMVFKYPNGSSQQPTAGPKAPTSKPADINNAGHEGTKASKDVVPEPTHLIVPVVSYLKTYQNNMYFIDDISKYDTTTQYEELFKHIVLKIINSQLLHVKLCGFYREDCKNNSGWKKDMGKIMAIIKSSTSNGSKQTNDSRQQSDANANSDVETGQKLELLKPFASNDSLFYPLICGNFSNSNNNGAPYKNSKERRLGQDFYSIVKEVFVEIGSKESFNMDTLNQVVDNSNLSKTSRFFDAFI
ncbi:hypothetical protein H4219_006143 [Mycoemilia scoparia]|uniref:Uncharacterized protein n=1 Tax=Mycoemilia scoparia TaxID=417184 RepID=A0A9W7ZKY7_9FUNG|nr:hypothetical protein H4219_006143 [Mycoemilia scoparia]